MSKHTPGPWTATKTKGGAGKVVDSLGFSVASMHMGTHSQQEADAHLIAAAPDMLEALEAAISDHEDLDDGRLSGNTVATIRNAIKKARGQT